MKQVFIGVVKDGKIVCFKRGLPCFLPYTAALYQHVCAKTIIISKSTFTSIQIYMASSTGKKILATIIGKRVEWEAGGQEPIFCDLSSSVHPCSLHL